VTLIQRFGSALNEEFAFSHAVYRWRLLVQEQWRTEISPDQCPHVQRAQRVGRDDQRAGCPIPGTSGAPSQGWLSRDEQSDHLNLSLDDEEGATLQQLQGHSITYRIAMGPQAGRKVLTACAARCKQFLPGKRMTMALISLAGSEDSRCMGAAFRLGCSEYA